MWGKGVLQSALHPGLSALQITTSPHKRLSHQKLWGGWCFLWWFCDAQKETPATTPVHSSRLEEKLQSDNHSNRGRQPRPIPHPPFLLRFQPCFQLWSSVFLTDPTDWITRSLRFIQSAFLKYGYTKFSWATYFGSAFAQYWIQTNRQAG